MPFGKHCGTAVASLPTEYLAWLLGRDLRDGGLRAAVHEEAARRNVDAAGTWIACTTRARRARAR